MLTTFHELQYALRLLRKNPGFSAIAILTLALGIGANTAIFSVVQTVLLRPLPFVHPEELVQIWNTYPAVPQAELSPGDFRDFREHAHSFSDMAAYADLPIGFNLTGAGEAERIEARYASSGLFPLLGVQPTAGRTFTSAEDHSGATPVLMLTHRIWQSRFGSDPSTVGRTLLLDGQSYLIVGVLPSSFRLAPSTDLWLPIGLYPDDLTNYLHHECSTIARLNPGTTLTQAQAELSSLNHQQEVAFPDTHKNWGVSVKAMEDASVPQLRTSLLVLFGAVSLVLLIACANIVNLLLARNATRHKEIGLRVTLGASSARLFRQLLTETILLALLGGTLGVLLASGILDLIKALVPVSLGILKEVGLNSSVLLFTFGVSMLAGIGCGLAPALQALKKDLHTVLKEGGRTPGLGSNQGIRNVLVVSEIALALIPLVGAGLLIRSFYRLLEVDPGFSSDHILSMQVDIPQPSFADLAKLTREQNIQLAKQQSEKFEQIARGIESLPGVKAVGGINVLPLGTVVRSASRFVPEGQPPAPGDAKPFAEIRTVSLRYLATMGIPLRAGRLLDEHDYGTQNILINDSMARRFWPNGDAIGKRINLCWRAPTPCWFPIVGVVGNVHQYGLEATPGYDLYFTGGWTSEVVMRTSANPENLAHAAVQEIHSIDASLPITHITTLDGVLADSLSPRRFSMALLSVFAILALALAAIGIYGVMSYIVSMRTGEIGIRMALGAQPRHIRQLIITRGAALASFGLLIGAVGAVALTRLLSSMLYAVKPVDPVTFLGVILVLGVIALLGCYIPARRAMRVDPMVALRQA